MSSLNVRSGRGFGSTARVAIIVVEVVAVLALLAVWVLSEETRNSRSLAVLFFYCFPSEFVIGLVPHEPVLLYWGAVHPALTVALVSAAGTVLAEALNYSVLGFFDNVGVLEGIRNRGLVARVTRLFGRAPFLAIVVAGLTPIPFVPIRFLVVMTHYPIGRYLLGVFVARAPRFFLIAWLGDVFDFGPWTLVALFAAMILLLNAPLLQRVRRRPSAVAGPPTGSHD